MKSSFRRFLRVRRQIVIGAMVAVGMWAAQPVPSGATSPVKPNGLGLLDCNGLSAIQKTIKRNLPCADPRGLNGGRFEINDHYIGHDEPAVRFISNRPGSASDITFNETMAVDPRALPTVAHPGKDVTHFFELSVAPWFSTSLCDSNSFPQNPCAPRSDANAPNGSYQGAGAAFLEVQFYPPGFAPFLDSISCDNTHWCSALVIWSLECDASGACNPNCIEPGNFAFIQTDGVPPGPPSPQLSNNASFTPNRNTLLIGQGDQLKVHIFDVAIPGGHALQVREDDVTTGRSGFMNASAANGFMHTNMADCSGTPYNFEPEYSSARAQNILPWGVGPYNVDSEFEIGHFEPCRQLADPATFTSGGFTDPYYQTCIGPYEKPVDATAVEPNDAPCFPAGDTHGGTAAPNLVTGCVVSFNAVGDLEYDGTPYWPDWPTSTEPNRYPATFLQWQPTSRGHGYESIQFETDTSGTQAGCDTTTGAGCALPAPGAPGKFYPYWTLAQVDGRCMWEFGNVRNGNTFGGISQYGAVTPTSIGAFTSAIQPNPGCGEGEGDQGNQATN